MVYSIQICEQQSWPDVKPGKITEDPRFAQAVQNYEAGLKCLQSHKYDKAKAHFEKVIRLVP